MKQRFYIYRRGRVYYVEDAATGKQTSLHTRNRKHAEHLVKARRSENVVCTQAIASFLPAYSDPRMLKRTWQTVMEEMQTHGLSATQERCRRAMRCRTFRTLKNRKLIETSSEDLLLVMRRAPVSARHYLKRLHNLALGLGWIHHPILGSRLWPKNYPKPKRGITLEEQRAILASEKNLERSQFYRFLWETGASQSDAAALTAQNIDRKSNCLCYCRKKTHTPAQMAIGPGLAELLEELPKSGPLFPKITKETAGARSAEFCRRCRIAKITGISLHSYRYAWAERAMSCGYPERFAQAALGHNSKAVHRAYARRAHVIIPPLEQYQRSEDKRTH